MSTHLARVAAHARSLLLQTLIRIPTSRLPKYTWFSQLTKRRLNFYASLSTRRGMSSQHSRLTWYCILFGLLYHNWNYVMIIEDTCTRSIRNTTRICSNAFRPSFLDFCGSSVIAQALYLKNQAHTCHYTKIWEFHVTVSQSAWQS